jgi:hypothetical protein
MRLEYNILWIEDEIDQIESTWPIIEESLENLGFIGRKTHYGSGAEVRSMNSEELSLFDLIIVDFNIGGGEKGSDVISAIRKNQIFTEVVFYSTKVDELRNKVRDLELDGVYCSSRGEFKDTVQDLIRLSVRKVQSLSQMRGLVMAETSELDFQMNEIIRTAWENSSQEEVEGIIKICRERISNYSERRGKEFKAFLAKEINLDLVLTSKQIHADMRILIVSRILELKGIFASSKERVAWENGAKEEIYQERNKLAHSKQTTKEGKEILTTWNGDLDYNHERFIDIRKCLITWKDRLENLKSQLSTPNNPKAE